MVKIEGWSKLFREKYFRRCKIFWYLKVSILFIFTHYFSWISRQVLMVELSSMVEGIFYKFCQILIRCKIFFFFFFVFDFRFISYEFKYYFYGELANIGNLEFYSNVINSFLSSQLVSFNYSDKYIWSLSYKTHRIEISIIESRLNID